jgi:hypothetical protein
MGFAQAHTTAIAVILFERCLTRRACFLSDQVQAILYILARVNQKKHKTIGNILCKNCGSRVNETVMHESVGANLVLQVIRVRSVAGRHRVMDGLKRSQILIFDLKHHGLLAKTSIGEAGARSRSLSQFLAARAAGDLATKRHLLVVVGRLP